MHRVWAAILNCVLLVQPLPEKLLSQASAQRPELVSKQEPGDWPDYSPKFHASHSTDHRSSWPADVGGKESAELTSCLEVGPDAGW